MTKGRKPRSAEVVEDIVLDQERVDGAMDSMRSEAKQLALANAQQESMVRAVAEQLGYSLPADSIDPDLIQRDIAANMRRSVEACLEVGRGLRVLKEACPHGQFLPRLETLGLEPRVAQKFMATAVKFANASSTPLLLAAGNQTKLFEMLVLDDEQIEELELTGQTGELKLDDIATMSVKELRAALREERAEKEAAEQLLADKNGQLDELRKKNRRIKTVPPDEVLGELLKETTSLGHAAAAQIEGHLRQGFVAIADHHEQQGGDSTAFMAGIAAMLQDTLRLRGEFGLPDSPTDAGWSPDESGTEG